MPQDLCISCDASLTGSVSNESVYVTSIDSSDDESDTSLEGLNAIDPIKITDNNCIASIVDNYDVL